MRRASFGRSSAPAAWWVPSRSRPSRPSVHSASERTAAEAQGGPQLQRCPAVFPPPPLPSMERGASHTLFRTTSSRALLRSSCLCTVPAGCAQTPQGWHKLGVRGAFPPLRPIALRPRKAWVIRACGGGDGEGSNACPDGAAAALLLTGPGSQLLLKGRESKRWKQTELREALSRKEEQPSRISQLESGPTPPRE